MGSRCVSDRLERGGPSCLLAPTLNSIEEYVLRPPFVYTLTPGSKFTRRRTVEEARMQYDDIIVGAGSSGAVVAARLGEDPNRSVLLLEAGPDHRTIEETPHDLLRTLISHANHDWGWTARARRERKIGFT